MKYNKAAIITPKHTAFVWNKNKQQTSIPDEYANSIKHVYLAKDFTCILNLINDSVCIKDESDTIVHTQKNVDKIVCEENFVCFLKNGSVECKQFEDKQKVLVPQFPEDIKMVDFKIKVTKNFYYYYQDTLKNQIQKQKEGDVQIPYHSDKNLGQQEYSKIVYCVIDEDRKIDCQINIVIADCNDCNQSKKIDFDLQVEADEYIINDDSICQRDKINWLCQSYEIQLDPSNISTLTKILYIKNTYPSLNFTNSQINKFYNDKTIYKIKNFPIGVQHNLNKTNFSNWKIQQEADWDQETHTSDIDKDIDCDIMFVGAQEKSSNNIYIGAQGLRNNIISKTNSLNQANEHNGVQWYYVERFAFGFSDTHQINLSYYGQVDFEDINSSEDKLSFSLQNNQGGGRAGNFQDTQQNDWVKIIQYLPKITNRDDKIDHESKHILDSASDGESSCKLGDALEISCQNFPKLISHYGDIVKQATQKQIDDQIEQYKLKQDDSIDDVKKEDDKDDYNQEIKYIEEIQKLENQSEWYLMVIIILSIIVFILVISIVGCGIIMKR